MLYRRAILVPWKNYRQFSCKKTQIVRLSLTVVISVLTLPAMLINLLIFTFFTSGVYFEEQKIGDPCHESVECSFFGGHCDPVLRVCKCLPEAPVSDFYDKCGPQAKINESCFFDEQCLASNEQTMCKNDKCACRFDLTPIVQNDGSIICSFMEDSTNNEQYIDFAMIGVLVGMFLMFIIICVVLQLFSRARWRENRTIFNTPNPRLMNASLLRESITEHNRRPSKVSTKSFSRQASQLSIKQSHITNQHCHDSIGSPHTSPERNESNET